MATLLLTARRESDLRLPLDTHCALFAHLPAVVHDKAVICGCARLTSGMYSEAV